MTTQYDINRLRRLSGLTWDELAYLFDVTKRDIHFWCSGAKISNLHKEYLNEILNLIDYINKGSSSLNRTLLFSNINNITIIELIKEGKFNEAKELIGKGNINIKPKLLPLSKEAQTLKIPPNPCDLVDALNDNLHKDVGISRVAKTIRSKQS